MQRISALVLAALIGACSAPVEFDLVIRDGVVRRCKGSGPVVLRHAVVDLRGPGGELPFADLHVDACRIACGGRGEGPPKQSDVAEKQAPRGQVAAKACCNRLTACYNNILAQGRGSSQHQDA